MATGLPGYFQQAATWGQQQLGTTETGTSISQYVMAALPVFLMGIVIGAIIAWVVHHFKNKSPLYTLPSPYVSQVSNLPSSYMHAR